MFEIIFPFLLFLLSFLITYSLLLKVKIFPKRINTIISLIIAFYFLSASVYYTENLMQLLAYSLLVLFVIFIIALIYYGRKGMHEAISGKKK